MKNRITLFLAATTIALGVVCAVQSHKSTVQQTQLVSLEDEIDAKSQQLERLQAAQKRSDRQRHELIAQVDELAAQLQAKQLAATNSAAPALPSPPAMAEREKPAGTKGGFATMAAKMLHDPDMREFLRSQQRMMVDQMYGPLVKKLDLTPDEANQFKELLADHNVQAAEKASAVSGTLASTNSTETLKTLTAEQKSFDEQVKAFLGDERYAQYQDYQQTVGERALLNQFKQQAGADFNLTEPQTEALLNIMNEEKKNVAASTGLPAGDANQDASKLQALISEDKAAQVLQAQGTVNRRVFERARTFLSPEQLETLGRFQTNQMQMMRVGTSMMRKMFAPDQATAAAPPPDQ